MGKRSRIEAEASASKKTPKSKVSILADEGALDPSLALLFSTSAGPVKPPPKSRYEEPPPKRQNVEESDEEEDDEDEAKTVDDDDELSSVDGDLDEADLEGLSEEEGESEAGSTSNIGEPVLDRIIEAATQNPDRKRKRKAQEEDLEGRYMQKLVREEEKEEEERQAERRLKRQKVVSEGGEEGEEKLGDDGDTNMDGAASEEESEADSEDHKSTKLIFPSDVPVHESLAPSKDAVELEKASRTVFLANVCTSAISSKSAKKTLLAHMGSFLPSLAAPPEGKPPHKVESLRFRSTAYGGGGLPKKAAFVKKDLMTATTKSTNAYVVYSTAFAAREAVKKLNGSMVLDRHLRVDGVAHPAKTDHRRCVFVGNLGFVDDESLLDQGGENERKRSKIPSDVEEGLWRQFSKAGVVESVRVVRDEKTRVGKGFAYVQFEDPNSVEAALLFNDKKYPPMLPRVLRVVRAKAVGKTANAVAASRDNRRRPNEKGTPKNAIYNPKVTAEFSSLKGRALKLLGRAGAAQFNKKAVGSGANDTAVGKRGDGARGNESRKIEGIAKPPEAFVFEGFRASAKNGKPKDLKLGGKNAKKGAGGKPKNRSANRASEWKKGGSKKTK